MIEPKKTSRSAKKYGNREAWHAEAEHMRAHPNETFIIDRRAYPSKASYAVASHVRRGGYVAFRPAGSFDAWVEREGDQLEVIAVYVGDATQARDDVRTVASTPAPATGQTVAAKSTPRLAGSAGQWRNAGADGPVAPVVL